MEISGRHRPGRRRCSGDRGGGGTGDGSAGQRGGRVALAGQAALDRAYADTKATVWRWRTAYQNDFAARMTWAIMPRFTDANHRPTLRLNGVGGLAPVEIAACYGEAVKLSAAGSRDVDGQPLTFRWWRYSEVTGRLTVKSVFDPADDPEANRPTRWRCWLEPSLPNSGAPSWSAS